MSTSHTSFSLRPLRTSDREALRSLFARLSPESRRRRFLVGKPDLSERELTYLTDIDHIRHEALTVIDGKDGSIVGVARYVKWPHRPAAADVAIEIADDLQRNGIGQMLAEALIRRARENGINVLTATTLWENRGATALARRVGFRARSSAGNEIELELRFDTARAPVRQGPEPTVVIDARRRWPKRSNPLNTDVRPLPGQPSRPLPPGPGIASGYPE